MYVSEGSESIGSVNFLLNTFLQIAFGVSVYSKLYRITTTYIAFRYYAQ